MELRACDKNDINMQLECRWTSNLEREKHTYIYAPLPTNFVEHPLGIALSYRISLPLPLHEKPQ